MDKFVVIASTGDSLWSQGFSTKEAAEKARLFLESVEGCRMVVIEQRSRERRRDDDDEEEDEGGRG